VVVLAFILGYWTNFIAPEFAVLLSFTAASLLNYRFEGKQRRFIKNVFRRYLSPQVIDRILADPDLLRLGGEKREITSFFTDLAGFTAISEGLSPEELVDLLNDYLSEMTDIILSQGGTLDKYEGDAIIAFWNAPLTQPDHALRTCRAALACQRRLTELRPDFQNRYGQELSMRIGINSGPAVVGNMGSRDRFDYTAMGDTINLASRLEGACKQYHVPILVGEETYDQVKEQIVTKEVDLIRVVGRKKPVRVFEILGEKGEVKEEELEKIAVFERALETYRQGKWDEALNLFQKIKNDMLAQVYEDRCQTLIQSGDREEWTGVYELKEK
jgi:adenylate cyclase